MKVYPRECGATVAVCASPSTMKGLSPRVRGNLNFRGPQGLPARSIPASAGQPRSGFGPAWGIPVYPRECGATVVQSCPGLPTTGLSPRVRGNPGMESFKAASTRSIPASAGQP